MRGIIGGRAVLGREMGGFDFGNTRRNDNLVASVAGAKLPKAMKTGTTICGVVFAVSHASSAVLSDYAFSFLCSNITLSFSWLHFFRMESCWAPTHEPLRVPL